MSSPNTLSRRHSIGLNSAKMNQKFGVRDQVSMVAGVLLTLLDQVTDGLLTAQYYQDGDRGWFAASLTFILLASCMNGVGGALSAPSSSSTTYKLLSGLAGFLSLGPALVATQIICGCGPAHEDYQSSIGQSNRTSNSVDALVFLPMFEAVLESAPQALLTAYVALKRAQGVNTLLLVSLALSVLSVSRALTRLQFADAFAGQVPWARPLATLALLDYTGHLSSRLALWVLLAADVMGPWMFFVLLVLLLAHAVLMKWTEGEVDGVNLFLGLLFGGLFAHVIAVVGVSSSGAQFNSDDVRIPVLSPHWPKYTLYRWLELGLGAGLWLGLASTAAQEDSLHRIYAVIAVLGLVLGSVCHSLNAGVVHDDPKQPQGAYAPDGCCGWRFWGSKWWCCRCGGEDDAKEEDHGASKGTPADVSLSTERECCLH